MQVLLEPAVWMAFLVHLDLLEPQVLLVLLEQPGPRVLQDLQELQVLPEQGVLLEPLVLLVLPELPEQPGPRVPLDLQEHLDLRELEEHPEHLEPLVHQ